MKRRILGCIFSDKIYFDEKKDATIIFTKPIEVIFKIFNELQSHKIKKVGTMTDFSSLAPHTDERCSTNSIYFYLTIWKLNR